MATRVWQTNETNATGKRGVGFGLVMKMPNVICDFGVILGRGDMVGWGRFGAFWGTVNSP